MCESIHGMVHLSKLNEIKDEIKKKVPDADIDTVRPGWEPASQEEHVLLKVDFDNPKDRGKIKDAIKTRETYGQFEDVSDERKIIYDSLEAKGHQSSWEQGKNIRCNNCMTYFEESDLELMEDEKGHFKGCPNCQTDACLMDRNP